MILRKLSSYRADSIARNESKDKSAVVLLISKWDKVVIGSTLYECGQKVFNAHLWVNSTDKSLVWYGKVDNWHSQSYADKDYNDGETDLFMTRLAAEYPEAFQYFLFHPDELFGHQ